MKKLKKSHKVLVLISIICTVFVYSFIALNITNTINLKSLKGEVETPANPAFTDMQFYKRVIEFYNRLPISPKLEYSDNITDEQLALITDLIVHSEVTDLAGLEKLTGLKRIDISNFNNITNLDILNNNLTSLEEIRISNLENLESIDLSSLNNLTSVSITDCGNLSEITFANEQNNKIEDLILNKDNFKTLDLTFLTKLKNLSVRENKLLTEIDIRNSSELKTIDMTASNLDTIKSDPEFSTPNLNNNPKLTKVGLTLNNLTSLDVSKNTLLETLFIDGNPITNIDLSKNVNLKSFQAIDANLSNIDLSSNTELTYLNLRNTYMISSSNENKISIIDLSNNTKLKNIDLRGNKLEEIYLKNNPELAEVKIERILKKADLTGVKFNEMITGNFSLLLKPVLVGDQIDLENYYISNTNKMFDNSFSGFYIYDENMKNLKTEYENELDISYDQDLMDGCIGSDFECGWNLRNYKITAKKPTYIISSSQIAANNELIFQINFIDLKSNKYEIDKESRYIFTGVDTDKEIIKNISIDYGKERENSYNILERDYSSSITKTISNDELIIKYDGEEIGRYKLGRISSDKYIFSDDSVEFDSFDSKNINVTNGLVKYEDGKIKVLYNNKVVKEYSVKITKDLEKQSNNTKEEKTDIIEENNTENKNSNKTISEKDNIKKDIQNNPSTSDNIKKYFVLLVLGLSIIISKKLYLLQKDKR